MPDDGAGTFSLTHDWETDRDAGTPIQADRMMEQQQDVADGLSNRICKDGQSTPTANIPLGGFKITNLGDATNATDAVNRQAGDARYIVQATGAVAAEVTVAGAATTDILGAASLRVLISGTGESITSLGTGTNRLRFVRFAGAHTLTHNATSLILPGGANITTAAGDTCIVCSDASSNARVYAYERASGSAPTLDAELNAIAGLTSAAGKAIEFTGSGTAALFDITTAGKALVDDADVATMRGTLELATTTTDNALIRANGTTGGTQGSDTILDDDENLSGLKSIAASRTDTSAVATFTSTDATATVWEAIILDRDSSTPANNDLLGKVVFRGRDDGDGATDYAGLHAQILDTTDTSEDGRGVLSAIVAGTYTDILKWGPGVAIGGATDQGAGTLNVSTAIYQNDVQVATLSGEETLTNKDLTSPDIDGGTIEGLTTFGIRSTGAAFDLVLASTEVFTASRTLTFDLNDAARTIDLAGNITLAGNLTTAGALITSGANSLTLTTTGATNVTLPTTGTLQARLATTVDNTLPRFDGTAGLLQTSSVSIDDNNTIIHPSTGALRGATFTLEDDTATSITLNGGATAMLFVIGNGTSAQSAITPRCVVYVRVVGTAVCIDMSGGGASQTGLPANVTFTTGALAGTTGTDTFFTVSAHTDGKVYFENRTGTSRTFSVMVVVPA